MLKISLYKKRGILLYMITKIPLINNLFLCLINFSVLIPNYDFCLKCFNLKNKHNLMVNFISLFKGMVFFV